MWGYRGTFCEKLPPCPIEEMPIDPKHTHCWPRPSPSVMGLWDNRFRKGGMVIAKAIAARKERSEKMSEE